MRINVADLFCGGGGETTGIIQAAKEAGFSINLAAVNHWQTAIETHHMNYPEVRAYCQDIGAMDPRDAFEVGDVIDMLWASPECTHHSNARGGKPRSEQGRTSAYFILKWLDKLDVLRVIIENVPEFMTWGPLGKRGRPLKRGKGKLFRAFIQKLRERGYVVEWRVLCAADYGDPTTRRRLFIQAAKGGKRILWPEPTHSKEPGEGTQPWRSAREIIDWEIQGKSIFDRKKPLAPATMQRIAAGIRRYWGQWAQPFLTAIDHVPPNEASIPLMFKPGDGGDPTPFILHQDAPGRQRPVDEPVPAIRSRNGHGLVRPFIVPYYGTGVADRVDEPLASVTGKDRFALVEGQPVRFDITFRMLQPHELAAAQGFPSGYAFAGNKSDQVKQIGNAVPAGLARNLVLAALEA